MKKVWRTPLSPSFLKFSSSRRQTRRNPSRKNTCRWWCFLSCFLLSSVVCSLSLSLSLSLCLSLCLSLSVSLSHTHTHTLTHTLTHTHRHTHTQPERKQTWIPRQPSNPTEVQSAKKVSTVERTLKCSIFKASFGFAFRSPSLFSVLLALSSFSEETSFFLPPLFPLFLFSFFLLIACSSLFALKFPLWFGSLFCVPLWL